MSEFDKRTYEKFSNDETNYYGFIRLNLKYNYNPYGEMMCPNVESADGLSLDFSYPNIGPKVIRFRGTAKEIYNRVFIPYLKDSKFYIEDDSALLSRMYKLDRLDRLISTFENYFSPEPFDRPIFPFSDVTDISSGIFYEKYPLSTYSSLANIEILTISEKANTIEIAKFVENNIPVR